MKPTKLEELREMWVQAVEAEAKALAAYGDAARSYEKAMAATFKARETLVKETSE